MVFFEGPEFYHDFAEPHEHDNIVQGGLLVREAKDAFHLWLLAYTINEYRQDRKNVYNGNQ